MPTEPKAPEETQSITDDELDEVAGGARQRPVIGDAPAVHTAGVEATLSPAQPGVTVMATEVNFPSAPSRIIDKK